MVAPLRIGFVTGATPDKWARHWRERRREPLELVPVTEAGQLDGVRDGTLDMAIVRLPVDREGLHQVRLYDELQVAVEARDVLEKFAKLTPPPARERIDARLRRAG